MAAELTLGAEEELHLIDLATSKLSARAPQLLSRLPPRNYAAEIQRTTVETNTEAVGSLAGLREELIRLRRGIVDVATGESIGIAAVGTAPISAFPDFELTATGRYGRMQEQYRLLVDEQLICGLQIHVGVSDRDLAVQIMQRIAADLPILLALSASSSGFGRAFVHADDVHGRLDAFDDVLACRDFLVDSGLADPGRIAVTGRSYGGYLTLASLAFSPGVFAAGVDICGMSDLQTFFRDTEPWIAAAAVSKYGDPEGDETLLKTISPLRAAANIDVPLLVVHGELDSNVPEARRYRSWGRCTGWASRSNICNSRVRAMSIAGPTRARS